MDQSPTVKMVYTQSSTETERSYINSGSLCCPDASNMILHIAPISQVLVQSDKQLGRACHFKNLKINLGYWNRMIW